MNSSTRVSTAIRLLRNLNLRFPTLFLILAFLTLLDVFIPDAVPFIDEIVLALLTLLIGTWKNRKSNGYRGSAK